MLLAGALFALFMTGFWLYCLTDAILTPAPECRGLTKPAWIAVIAVTFIVGALAWIVVRQPARHSARPVTRAPRWDPDEPDAVTRHLTDWAWIIGPQSAPKGPDDDPEFLRALDRAINGNSADGEQA
jgi:Phospholipase_D-nuclease N-terminal